MCPKIHKFLRPLIIIFVDQIWVQWRHLFFTSSSGQQLERILASTGCYWSTWIVAVSGSELVPSLAPMAKHLTEWFSHCSWPRLVNLTTFWTLRCCHCTGRVTDAEQNTDDHSIWLWGSLTLMFADLPRAALSTSRTRAVVAWLHVASHNMF